MDATANMYLALTVALSAGIIGCLNEEPLLWPDMGLTVEHFPTSGTALPEIIGASLEQLGKTYHEFQDIMDSQVMQHYICVKRLETSKLQSMSPEAKRS